MEVILLERMRNLGALGDKVKVKPGFARNYLIPQGKAVYANARNLAQFEQRRAELEKLAAEKHAQALVRLDAINALSAISFVVKAGDEGKLFGSINARDVIDKLNKAGIAVEKREIRLPQGTLRMVGEYEVFIDLESDMTATVKISVIAEA